MSKQYKSQIRRRWELPAAYWMLLERCCGLRTVWSNDTYEALELWGLDTLVKGQEGYAYNPVEQKVIKDWDEHLVVIASDAGDPYCLDLRRNDTAVFWAEHGAGTWDFQPAFDCLEDFLESVLDVPKTQEYPDVMDIGQMCEALGVSTKTGYKLLKDGKIEYLKIGRAYRIPKAHILRYLKITCSTFAE